MLCWKIRQVASSENYSYKCKVDQTLLFQVPLTKEAKHFLAYSHIYQSDLSSCGQALFDSLRESGNLPHEIASITHGVKYSKVNPLSFKILIGISPALALFDSDLL